mmetsp:Transcript_41734/g.48205  ORF Transcript_41734/g.48205 Transcript_41734/m.48205 type:complete len:89 (+) Transcript_41734:172-438(+)
MTKPVTNHPNAVRVFIRKWLPESVWKLVFCRQIYKRSLQNFCVMWFTFFVMLVLYCLFVGMWLIDKIKIDYEDDTTFHHMTLFVLTSS